MVVQAKAVWLTCYLCSSFCSYSTGLMLSAVGTAGAGAVTKASSVQVGKTATVGSYAISTLKPSQPDGLDGWLAENGFAALPEAAGPIIADYISQGWVFAAIKLTRGESGANAPHPIKLVFASKDAVYPMKLTAIAGGKPGFELFVIGDGRASCDTLEEEFCDRFAETEDRRSNKPEMHFGSAGRHTTLRSRPLLAICPLMWDNCVLTKFVGNVDAAGMTKDIRFAWKPFKSHQESYFTQEGLHHYPETPLPDSLLKISTLTRSRGIASIITRKRSYLAHAPGTGKTAEAILAGCFARDEGQSVFIVRVSDPETGNANQSDTDG